MLRECLWQYLRGERETERMGDLDTLRAGDPLPLRAGLTEREGDLEADLQVSTSSLPSARLSCCCGSYCQSTPIKPTHFAFHVKTPFIPTHWRTHNQPVHFDSEAAVTIQ